MAKVFYFPGVGIPSQRVLLSVQYLRFCARVLGAEYRQILSCKHSLSRTLCA